MRNPLLIALALIALLGGGALLAVSLGWIHWVYRDGEVVWRFQEAPSVRQVLWSPPAKLAAAPRRADDPADPEKGGLDPVVRLNLAQPFVSAQRKDAEDFDIYIRYRRFESWTEPVLLAPKPGPLNTTGNEITPTLTRDGEVLYFASDRDGGLGGYDLYASLRHETGWTPPVNLGRRLNSPFDDQAPALHPRQPIIVFATNRPHGFLLSPPADWERVPLEHWRPADFNLGVARQLQPERAPRGWSEPRPLEGPFSAADDVDPAFAPAGDYLYFASNRSGATDDFDIYRSRCAAPTPPPNKVEVNAGAFRVGAPETVGSPINSPQSERLPRIFLEGFAMTYEVHLPGKPAMTLETRSREVDTELAVASIPWTTLAEYALRALGLILWTAAMVLGAWLLVRYRRRWSASLQGRCAVVALLIHGLSLYGFYFWKVGTGLVTLQRKSVLAEVTVDGELTAQLTLEAQAIEVEIPDTPRENTAAAPELRKLPAVASAALSPPEEAIQLPASPPAERTPDLHVVAAPRAHKLPDRQRAPLPLPVPQSERRNPVSRSDSLPSLTPTAPAPEPWNPRRVDGSQPRSVKVATDVPLPGAPGTELQRESPTSAVRANLLVQSASAPVVAPHASKRYLPEPSRAPEQPTPEIRRLPVIAQSAAKTAETTLKPARQLGKARQDPAPTPSPDSPPSTLPGKLASARAVPWTAPVSGAPRNPVDAEAAKPIPVSPPRPATDLPPVPGARRSLPQESPMARAPTGERPRRGDDAPSRRLSKFNVGAESPAGAPNSGTRNTIAALPMVVPQPATPPPTVAASLRLDASPSPGLPKLQPRAATQGTGQRVRLPEGEGGRRSARGSKEVGDVLGMGSPRRRLRKATSRGESSASAHSTATIATALVANRGTTHAVAANLKRTEPTPSPRSPSGGLRERSPATSPTLVARIDTSPLPELSRDNGAPDLKRVRARPSRQRLLRELGGNDASEGAVRRALEWLARHQSKDGRWDVDEFDSTCQACSSPGFQTQCDVAVTGLAVLAFLGQNHSPANAESPFRRNVSRGLDFLLSQQEKDGLLRGEDRKYVMYSHGIATLALSEAFILTNDTRYQTALKRAAVIIEKAQHPQTGGWRYLPAPPIRGDTSVTGWQVMALTSLRAAGVKIADEPFRLARHWLDVEVASGKHGGIYGYSKPEDPRTAMVAEGMFARQLLGAKRTDLNMEEAARYIQSSTRRGEHLNNLYLLYYGNLALFHYGGWIWERWNAEVRDSLIRRQRRKGPLAGSWDPTGQWSDSGGRVLATCFATLTLEVYYRYLPLYWKGLRNE